ncbi:MAG: pilus assembly protein TadG-related protein [Acidimicrobiia bacterium]
MIFARPRRCERSDESGSIVIGFALSIVVVLLALGVGSAGMIVAAHTAAANAADAAALAAAPVTFRPFGASGSPAGEAAKFASINGAQLRTCTCPVDRSWDPRTVTVYVVKRLRFPVVGLVTVEAESRATFEPLAMLQAGADDD